MKRMRIFAAFLVTGFLGISCASQPGINSFGPYSAAETYYNKGNYPKAIEKYQEYLAKDPQGSLAAIAKYYTAKSYLVLGNTGKARENFEQVVKQFPGTSWADFSKDQLELLNGSAKS
jgi:TolA-binding protein